jgi:hypothetical protein
MDDGNYIIYENTHKDFIRLMALDIYLIHTILDFFSKGNLLVLIFSKTRTFLYFFEY